MPNDNELKALAAKADELRATFDKLRQAVLMRTEPAAPLLESARGQLDALRTLLRLTQKEVARVETRVEQAEREMWEQKVRRADASARLAQHERLLEAIQTSAVWKVVKPFWKLLNRSARKQTRDSAPGDLEFAIEAPTSWATDAEVLVIRGWCFSRSGRPVAGVRAKFGRKSRFGRYGLERKDVAALHGDAPAARQCGFTIELRVPNGTSQVRIEAIEQGRDWEPFFAHELRGLGNHPAEPAKGSEPAAAKPRPRYPAITAGKTIALLTPLFREHAARVGSTSPRFSVITPSFDTKPQWLAEAAVSLLQQSFDNWEWRIADDGSRSRETLQMLQGLAEISPRLRIQFAANAGISAATNAALDRARGEFVCFLDHDDLLEPDALKELHRKLSGGFDVVYSDEDKLAEPAGKRVEPFFKPDWSPEYFRGAMYVGHLLSVRRELARRTRFDSDFDGVQDFEFMLRVSETGAKIGHVPKVLYHWRKTPGSIAQATDAKPEIGRLQERAVNAHLQRLAMAARAEQLPLPHRLRIVPTPRAVHPKISIIIPTKDAPDLLRRCLGSLFEKTSYPSFEVLLVDNGSTDAEALRLSEQYPVRRIDLPGRFNFSRANNVGAHAASGSFLVFLNNDTEIITPDWLEHLLYYAEQRDVAAAGALLVYEDRTVQHAGVALGMRGTADHVMRGFPMDVDGYAGSLASAREVSSVTAACMMTAKALFDEVGGFNEHFFTAYQDVDLCLRLRGQDRRIIYTPQSVVVHHESASRKSFYDMVDRILLLDQWEHAIKAGDPYYNRNLDLERGDYSIAYRW